MEITISATRRRWWGTQTKEWRRWLPQSWKDMPHHRRFLFWAVALQLGEGALERICIKLLKLPRWAWRSMDATDRQALSQSLAWMLPKYDCTVVPFPEFKHRGETYYMPKAKFENGCCLEFVLADGYYNKYRETGDEEVLLRLVATLCRPASKDKNALLLLGDNREQVVTKEQVEARMQRLKGLHPAMQVAVLMYFVGVKEYIANTYWMLFSAPPVQENEEEEVQQEETTRGPKFGWWSKFMEVANEGLFGNYDEVLQKRLHLICMHLVDEHEKNEQARLEMARQKSKYSNDAY